MKKIIYKIGLKKILISMLLIIILFEVIMPNIVLATDETKTYNEWLEWKSSEKNIIESSTKSYVNKNIYQNIIDTEEREKRTEKLLNERGDKILITGEYRGGTTSQLKITNLEDKELSIEELKKYGEDDDSNSKTYTYDELKSFTGKTKEELDAELIEIIQSTYFNQAIYGESNDRRKQYATKVLEAYRSVIKITVEGTKDNYKIISVDIQGIDKETIVEIGKKETNENEANVGGILLSPIFYLVNYVADAITSNIGRIMMGEEVSAISGVGILTSTKPNLGYTKTSDAFPVNIESFLINALSTSSYQYPNIKYTPEEIFAGKIDLLSIDFISGKDYSGAENTDSDWTSIRKVISQWYKVLRMIAIVGLLSVLIYTGIKIMISANAKDKAKYKEWIINWFIAVAILFSMHYIMSFIIAVTGEINSMLSGATQGIKVELINDDGPVMKNGEQDTFVTNLMGLVRFMIQSENFYIKVGYEVMYIALIVYTIKFTLIYLKRVLNMAFLTLIAPIVALTYPIDKLNDGQAQGFNMWLKEYIFNALLQPMHYIMYYILVGSAVSIAASNPIYGIVVLMFMTEAEKLLKKIFGFDKAGAGTVGGMAGAFAAGAIASSVKDIAKLSKKSGGNADKGGSGTEKSGFFDNLKATKDDSDMSTFLNESNSQGDLSSAGRSAADDNSEQDSVRQRMLDADYEDSFGTSDYDGERMNALEQDVNNEENQNHERSAEEYRQELEALGFEGEELDEAMEAAGYGNETEDDDGIEEWDPLTYHTMRENDMLNDEGQAGTPPSSPAETSTSQTPQNSQSSQSSQSSQAPIRDMAKRVKNSRRYKGFANVGKTLAKPVWDFEKSNAYNGKRLARNIARGALGVGIGVTAAAVQAGISITDGKYNPMEGIGTFAAGYAGAGQIFKGAESLGAVYNEGAYAGDKEAQMKRAKAKYGDRDDVIAYNKKNYAGREKEMMERQRDNWLEYGYYNPKDMKSGIKYADAYIKNKYGDNFKNLSAEEQKRITKEADTRAIQTMRFRKTLEGQGQSQAIYDEEKRKKYIEMMVKKEVTDPNATATDKERVRNKYRNAFNAVIEYDDAQ